VGGGDRRRESETTPEDKYVLGLLKLFVRAMETLKH